MKKAVLVQPDGAGISPQEASEVFNQPRGGLGEWLTFEITADARSKGLRVDVEGLASVSVKQIPEHFDQPVRLVVDDVGDLHAG